ncbi:ribokinase [Zhihengliuella halotolerans]|uniref:Ribokinase n=1 Tax=Zhihengliuella halotolerans TaxID=370736 RepID=A0A4Q8AEK6_9MICC|nr:ribokinase [Zhihengliuella halotolerans]RZU62717.1 ribokinase [Zhihengliuella halotolerans]
MSQHRTVTIIGSSNADLAVTMDRLPGPGETVLAHSFITTPGGKGANQALAARLAGAETEFIGAVGRDANADVALGMLAEAGVELSRVRRVDEPTGVALISIDAAAENSIAVVPGANATVTADVVAELGEVRGVVVLQGEIPAAAVEQAAAAAERVVLNLAPVIAVDLDVIRAADPLVVNEHEAALVLEQFGGDGPAAPEDAARALLGHGVRSVVITLGAAGSLVAEPHDDGARLSRVDAIRAEAVDTTGAGDAYTGALAARLAAGDELIAAAGFAARFSAASVAKPGAQASYPRTLDELPGA